MSELGYIDWNSDKFRDLVDLDHGREIWFNANPKYPVNTGKFHGPLQPYPTECSRDRLERILGFKLLDTQWEWIISRNRNEYGVTREEWKEQVGKWDVAGQRYIPFEDWRNDGPQGAIRVEFIDEYSRWLDTGKLDDSGI